MGPSPAARNHTVNTLVTDYAFANINEQNSHNSLKLFDPAMFSKSALNQQMQRSVSMNDYSVAQQQARINHASHQGRNLVNASRYKTEICRPFSENGFCKYGEKCQFAHGDHEMKSLPRHPKYKTELCRTFHTAGFCPYGPRCHFIHSEDKSKLTEISHMKQQQAAQAAREIGQQAAEIQTQQQIVQAHIKQLVGQVQQQIITQMAIQGLTAQIQYKGTLNRSISVPPIEASDTFTTSNVLEPFSSTADSLSGSTSSGSPVLSPVFSDDAVSEMSLSDSMSSNIGWLAPSLPSVTSSSDSLFNFPIASSTSCSSTASLLSPRQHRHTAAENRTPVLGINMDQDINSCQPLNVPSQSFDTDYTSEALELLSRLPAFNQLNVRDQ